MLKISTMGLKLKKSDLESFSVFMKIITNCTIIFSIILIREVQMLLQNHLT